MKTLHKVAIATASLLVATSAAFAATISIGGGTITGGPTTYTGSDTVTVAATVNPVLSMTVSGTTLDFGALTLGAANTLANATNVSVLSNATSFSVDATYTDLLRSGEPGVTVPFTVAGHAAPGGNVITQASYSATAVTQDVTYVATPAANQKAGSYGTTVTYTVTGNF